MTVKCRVLYAVEVFKSLKLDCCNYRMLYVIPMVSTKKISIEYIEEYIFEGNQNVSLQKIS